MSKRDRMWISQAIYDHKGELKTDLQCWWHPPEPPRLSVSAPDPDRYFLHRLFLWMPRKMYLIQLFCTECKSRELTSKGLYNRVRLVVDVSSHYYLATEYLECRSCKRTYISWSQVPYYLNVGQESVYYQSQSNFSVYYQSQSEVSLKVYCFFIISEIYILILQIFASFEY